MKDITRETLYRFIFKTLWQRKTALFYFSLATTLTNLLSLAIPIVLMQTYDRTIKSGSTDTHTILIVGGIVAVIFDMIIKMARESMINRYATEYEIEKGAEIIEKVLYGDTKKVNEMNVGSLIDSFNSVSKVKNLVSGKIVNTLLDIPFVFIFLALIMKLNLTIGLFLLGVFASYILLAVFHKGRFQHFSQSKKEIEDKKTSFFVDILSKITIVKSMTYEERLIRKNEFLEKQNTNKNLLIKSYDIVPDSLGVLVSQIVLFGILGIGAAYVVNGEMTIGVLTACVLLGNRFFQPVQSFVTFYFNLSGHQLAYRNIEEIMQITNDEEKTLPDMPQDIDGSIQIKDVTISDEEEVIFEKISLDIKPKSLAFFEASDKSGITNLMRSVLGQQRINSGKISFDNYDSEGFNSQSIQNLIGYIPQKAELFNGTVLENITMFESKKNQIALDSASMVGLDELVAKLPNGYDTELTSRSSMHMPVGIVLRIILARVLLRHPKIIIFDRTYQSMDHDAQIMLSWLVGKLKGKMTIVFIAKNLPETLKPDQFFCITESSEIREQEVRSA